MITLDGQKKLNPELMQEFVKDLNDDSDICILLPETAYEIKLSDVKNWSFIDVEINDDTPIEIVSNYKNLKILGIDYVWWSGPRRKKKLFNFEKVKAKPAEVTKTISVATLLEEGLTDTKTFTGTKKEIVNFMNDELSKRMLQTFNDGIVLFKFDDSKDWMTLDELQQKGLITLR